MWCHEIYYIDVIDSLAHEVFELDGSCHQWASYKEHEKLALGIDFQETVTALDDCPKLQHSGNIHYIALLVYNERHVPSIL